MKLILSLIIISFSLSAVAQDTTWTKFQEQTYGTRQEKLHQDITGRQTENRFLCRFIGFKKVYDKNISEYLQYYRNYKLDDSYAKEAMNYYLLFKKGVYIEAKPLKITVGFSHDQNNRIIQGKVIGPLPELAYLFLNFWPKDRAYSNAEQLKPGKVAAKHVYGDLISFEQIGNNAIITISKDEGGAEQVAKTANSK